jgi:hypothetical protein
MATKKLTKAQENNAGLRPPKMQHIRQVKPELWVHESFNAMTPLARFAAIGSWTCCDKFGRFESAWRSLKRLLLPYDEVDMPAIINEWVARGFVALYEVDGKQYGRWVNWSKHQYIGNKEMPSKFAYPAPNQVDSSRIEPTLANPLGVGVGLDVPLDVRADILTPTANGGAAKESTSKDKSGQEKIQELWTDLRTRYAAADTASVFPPLKRAGIAQVWEFIASEKYPRPEVMEAWTYWLMHKYQDQLGDSHPIHSPLSVFVKDAEAQILNIRTTVQRPLKDKSDGRHTPFHIQA